MYIILTNVPIPLFILIGIVKEINMFQHRVLNNVISLYDWSLLARKSLLVEFPMGAFLGLGTERHRKYINSLMNLEVCFIIYF